jgi:hypothetical protein
LGTEAASSAQIGDKERNLRTSSIQRSTARTSGFAGIPPLLESSGRRLKIVVSPVRVRVSPFGTAC